MTAVRGTSNGNCSGSSRDRAARRTYLVNTFRADQDLLIDSVVVDGQEFEHLRGVWHGDGLPACRCYRCGRLLADATLVPGAIGDDGLVPAWHVTVDRIVPGCKGGTYRRDNIRPACGGCNSETGGALGGVKRRRKLVTV